MNNREQYKRLIIFLEAMVLLLIHTVLYVILWFTFYVDVLDEPMFRRGNWALIAAYPVMLIIFGKIFGIFNIPSSRRSDLVFSNLGITFLSNLLIYFLFVLAWRKYIFVWPLIVLFIAENLYTIIWVILVKKLNNILFPPHELLLIHGDYSFKEIVFTMNRKSERYSIVETIGASAGLDIIFKRAEAYDSVLISDMPAQMRNDILKYCYDKNKRVYMLPKLTDIIIRSASDVHISDTQIFLLKNYGLSFDQKLIKRIGDIFISGIGIILSSWLMCIIAVMIRSYDHGPVFFRQDRLTRDGKVFKIIKFRSMDTDAEKEGPQLMKEHDSRVTPVGRFLRASHLDELPQLFNVFTGTMSIVGPRPERPEIMEEYINIVPEFKYRLKVKGGITGFAQVYGKYNTTPYNKLRLDLFYIQNYSIWMDLKCLVGTLKVVFRKETSQGVAQEQTTAIKNDIKK